MNRRAFPVFERDLLSGFQSAFGLAAVAVGSQKIGDGHNNAGGFWLAVGILLVVLAAWKLRK